MSTGAIHYKYYIRGYRYSIPISVASAFVDWKFGIGYLAGYTLHRYVDNDWDIQGVTSSESRAVNELPVIGLYIFGVSSVYGAVFRKRHRKWETHVPVISTIIRLVVLFLFPFLVGDGYGVNFIGGGWIWFWLGLWSGLSHADGIHLYHDIVGTED